MPDEKRYTERDLIKAQRDAFALAGQRWSALNGQTIDKLARQAFPLPPQTRPRVVTDDNGRQFRIADGQLQSRHPKEFSGAWLCMESGTRMTHDGGGVRVNRIRVAMWADLYANPTEPVPDEEG